jgi:chitodextrinase
MSKKKSREQSKQTAQPRSRRRLTATIALILILATNGVIIAQRTQFWATMTEPETSVEPQSQPTLAKEYIYAGGRLVATEEPPGTTLSPPSDLVATATSANQISLSWTASPGTVDHYAVWRTQSIALPYSLAGSSTSTTFTDTNLTSGTTYLYKVRAVGPEGNTSDYSNLDLATTVIFTDDPLTAGVTQIKAQHVTQLREAVNAVRLAANLQAASWTDPSLVGLAVKAVHIQELRGNLDPARSAIGVPAQSYSNQPLAQGIIVYKAHIEELRQGVK